MPDDRSAAATAAASPPTVDADRLAMLSALERKALWLSHWMIHNANHLRPKHDGLKVGGHQASCASMVTLMTALYFHLLRPEDRVAVKPHASPVFHAIQYLLGHQSVDKMKDFRSLGGAQSYPSRTKDTDDVDISTGSVGLGAAQTVFASIVQDYLDGKGWKRDWPDGRMIALVGDAELDEGNIYEALLEGWKNHLRNCWWIIDYNRQSLDAVVREGLYARFDGVFRAFGWEVVTVKYGHRLQEAFAQPGGDRLREWIDACPNQLYSALTFQGGAAWRKRLLDELGDQGPLQAFIESHSDDDLQALMTNLGGHDLPALLEAFETAPTDRPVVFICYTVKGYGTPLAGHKDNHGGIMTPEQMAAFRQAHRIRDGEEWAPFEGLETPAAELKTFLKDVPFNAKGRRRLSAPRVSVPERLTWRPAETMSTQAGFGTLMDELGRSKDDYATRILTTSPDVASNTGLTGWINRTGLFSRLPQEDTFKAEKVPSMQKWQLSPEGRHVELGIAEMNLFLMLSAAGLSHDLFGERLLPVGTLYDPFVMRGLDALNYACYQDARFILAGTPSGVTLAPEGGAHQSVGTPLIGMAQDGLAAFEPAWVDELEAILAWSLDYIQRDGSDPAPEHDWLRDEKGGSVYLRLSTRGIEQPSRTLDKPLRDQIVAGGYWLREPTPATSVVLAYQGAVAPNVLEAASRMTTTPGGVGILSVTSADRLDAGWRAAQRTRRREGEGRARPSHVERLMARVPRDALLVTIIDGHPATLSWLGGVRGHRVQALGVEHFGQSGSIADLHHAYGLDADAIVAAVAEGGRGEGFRQV
ncbi:Pyruvate dehydrogenase E1 component [Caenispirillum salinarum AK4]|uniref:Pyruvate dehydrogenase E1 component n=1 Tax=Caenispirillum salinarum AK4 TaxID=1238182 RepID=K9HVH9_9PROT|nr:Pyruvate dehydrogenase E1 component [Caenispirillum salinarum AK4]